MMKARINVAPIKEKPEPVLFSNSSEETGTENRTYVGDENRFYGKWRTKAEISVERNLHCTATSENFGKFFIFSSRLCHLRQIFTHLGTSSYKFSLEKYLVQFLISLLIIFLLCENVQK